MDIGARQLKIILEALDATVTEHAAELGELDRAIGDGDHGVNLMRGFNAVAQRLDEIVVLPLGEALGEVGKRLVMTVGGASGPLYGTFFLALGKELGGPQPLSRERLVAAFDAAVAAVKARGKADVEQKTLLDVLVPVMAELHADGSDLLSRVRSRAAAAAAATTPMLARRGRAAFLGERSIGHLDPGARSSQLLIEALCDALSSAQCTPASRVAGQRHAQ